LKNRKKEKSKKFYWYWLLVDLAIAAFIFALLLHRPARYGRPDVADSKQVSQYLTNELLPDIYNKVQRDEPFDITIMQERTVDIVGLTDWPKESEGITLLMPKVFFIPRCIMLMGTAVVRGVELVVTIVAEPALDRQGLLNLHVRKVKVGAINITPLAKVIAKRMYAQTLATINIDTEDIRTQIAASLLNDEPFEPVFKIKGKKVRVEEITITQEKLTIRLVPASD